MSDKQDKWNDLLEEDESLTETGEGWEEADPEGEEYWIDESGETLSGMPSDDPFAEPPPEELSAEEDGDSFAIDESLFGPEENYQTVSTDTSVIPPEVRDLSAYTSGGTRIEPEILDGEDYFEDLGDASDEGDYDYDDEDDGDYYDERRRAISLRRRRRTGLLGGMMYAAFLLGVSTILAFAGWMVVDDVLGLTKEDVPVEITIPERFTMEEVADLLHEGGLVNFPTLFIWYANMFGGYDRIQPGVYQVRPVDFRAMIGSMNQRTGELIEVRVMIPEGRTMRQTFQILEEAGVATVESLEHVVATVDFSEFEFLADLPMTTMNRLEGYLFPDTYDFFRRQDPVRVIHHMLSNFENRMEQNDVFELVESSPFTLHEILNIASMIERETASIAEMPRISSVIWNRISAGMTLGIDATIQYLLPEPMEFLTLAVIEEHRYSPYNTYHVIGLPYGPIANPGVAAILAALRPEQTSFLFYALHIDGDRHHFTNSYAEHNAFLNTPEFAHFGVFD